MRLAAAVVVILGAVALAACGEKQMTQVPGGKRVDAQAFEGTQKPYAEAGWKSGDRASWEAQLRARVQNQNEYNRSK